MASIIRIANLCKTYEITNTQRQAVLKGVNAEFETGEMVGIIGESGCGKSTLMHIIAGLDLDYTGSLVVHSKFIRDFSEEEMDNYRKNKVGMVFQNYNLISHMTLAENIGIAMEMTDTNAEVKRERSLELLQLVGLREHADKYPNQLSGGQKQRVAIARSMANNPSIILADEPTGALDKESTELVISILKKIADMGKLVLIVTHSERIAEECSRIIRLDDGVVVSDEVRDKRKKEFKPYKQLPIKNIKSKTIFKLSLNNLLSQKNRSILVGFAMSIGIAAVILILCLSSGLTNYVKDYYQDSASTSILATMSSSITEDEIDIVEDISGVSTYHKTHSALNVTYAYQDTSNNIPYVYTVYRNFTPSVIYGEEIASENELIISLSLATSLDEKPIGVIGQTIDLTYKSTTQTFTIVGIYDDLESQSTAYINENGMNNFSANLITNILYIKVSDITYLEAVQDELINEGFSVVTFEGDSQTILEYIDLGTSVLTGVAMISLFVSAILIIIVQYISVVERTQEIGILRAIGARRKDINNMFIYEAGILGAFSGILGVIISLLLSSIINVVCYFMLDSIFISYNILFYLLGLVVSILVSIIAGIAPSKKAASLDPIEALRFE